MRNAATAAWTPSRTPRGAGRDRVEGTCAETPTSIRACRRAAPDAPSATPPADGGSSASVCRVRPVGCCDSSLRSSERGTRKENGHPIIRSYEPGEAWFWDYRTQASRTVGTGSPAASSAGSDGARRPSGRVPDDWADPAALTGHRYGRVLIGFPRRSSLHSTGTAVRPAAFRRHPPRIADEMLERWNLRPVGPAMHGMAAFVLPVTTVTRGRRPETPGCRRGNRRRVGRVADLGRRRCRPSAGARHRHRRDAARTPRHLPAPVERRGHPRGGEDHRRTPRAPHRAHGTDGLRRSATWHPRCRRRRRRLSVCSTTTRRTGSVAGLRCGCARGDGRARKPAVALGSPLRQVLGSARERGSQSIRSHSPATLDSSCCPP